MTALDFAATAVDGAKELLGKVAARVIAADTNSSLLRLRFRTM
jgi:hypothetical protein